MTLPNNEILFVGGSNCHAQTINAVDTIAASPSGATESGTTVTITTTLPHGYLVGSPVLISGVGVAGYNGLFTIASIVSTTAFTYTNPTSALAGSGGGKSTENPSGASCGAAGFAGFQCDALQTADLYNETTQTFTPAGAGSNHLMTTERSGATATLLQNGKVLISGGSTGSTFLSLSAPPTGCGPLGQVAQNSAEIYDPVADTFTATGSIPGCTAGTAPPSCTTGLPAVCTGTYSTISTATESGSTVTITDAANPSGLTMGGNVTISGVSVAGYNGVFAVTNIPNGTSFQYTDVTGLASGANGSVTAGAATATAQCGLVDSDAQLLNNGKVLIVGGDYLVFLGQASQQAFIFDPGAATFSQTVPMNVARELPGISILPSGDVLVAGGITSNAAGCVGLPAGCTGAGAPNACCTGAGVGTTCGPVDFITNYSGEVYDPAGCHVDPDQRLVSDAGGGGRNERPTHRD